ncbi:MAG TPA: NADP-dependent oxidoreductase [Propionicimonas sp.]|jgi:NADPH:quinone reductase-like Zn-dependent oxidoreductase
MSRAVVVEQFGGPEVLEVREVPEPHAGPGQIRVRVSAAGLNPSDWKRIGSPAGAAARGLSLPTGFGNDLAGTVDEVGEGAAGFAVGDRVFGGAPGRAVAEHALLTPGVDRVAHTPDGIDDVVASALVVAVTTADAVVQAIGVRAGDTVLVGGAGGGVGVFVVQLAVLAGARVIGTGSEASAEFLRQLGAEPVLYGDGLEQRVRALAPGGVTAAADLVGVETARAAIALGVPADRVATIAAADPPAGVRRTGGLHAAPDALERVAGLVASGRLSVPIEDTYPLEHIREAVERQRAGHVHGKLVVTLAG